MHKRLYWFAFTAATIIAAAVLVWLWPRGLALVLKNESGQTLYSRPVERGEFFTISFTHSLAKSLVEETFEITSRDEFRLRETRYGDFGAGLPHEETPGLRMEFANGRIRLTGYDVKFKELTLRVGHIADHHIAIAGNRPIRLSDLMRPGGAIRVTLAEYPRGFGWLLL